MGVDYESKKVPELKKLIKDRGIAATGLTRKAQFIAKLEEYDAQAGTGTAAADDRNASADDVTIAEDTQAVEDSPSTAQPKAGSTTSSITLPADEPQVREATPESVVQATLAPTVESPAAPAVEPTIQPTSEPVPKPHAEPTILTTQDRASVPPQPGLSAESSVLTTPVPTQEIAEDSRKRKRRSLTPPVDAEEMAIKKQKQEEVNDPDVSFTEATEAEYEQPLASTVDDDNAPPAGSQVDEQSEEQKNTAAGDVEIPPKATEQAPVPTSPPLRKPSTIKDVRYKSLFNTGSSEDPVLHTPVEETTDLPPTEDAIHPTTRALYIRNFQRPLLPHVLRQHLISVAKSPGSTDDTDLVEKLHLDQVRTHAFVLFTNAVSAVRAREALHNRVWPAERDRKQLWVDFIPEENVQAWIDRETNDDGGIRSRWEVTYLKGEDGTINTSLVEAGGRRSSQQVGIAPMNVPTGPRSMNPAPVRPASRGGSGANALPASQPRPNTDASFQKLDNMFKPTTAKPMIYWKVVDPKIVADRKAELEKQTSRDWSEKDYDENDLMRFSFEDGDKLVHSGKHITSYWVKAREDHIIQGRSGPPPSAPRGRGGFRGGYRGGNRDAYSNYRGGSYRP